MGLRFLARFAAAVVWLFAPLMLPANGLRLASHDGFASARGEAFVATADNPSAIYYNPAGITQLEGDNLRGGIYGIHVDTSFRPPTGRANSGNTYHIQDELAAAPALFCTHTPQESPWSFGFAAYAPYGGQLSWPQDTGFRTVALSSSLKYVTLNPVVALKLSERFSIACGLMVNYANMELETGLSRSFRPPNTNYFRFKGDGWSAGYNLGVLWRLHEKISIGATFRSQATSALDGRTEFEHFTLLIPFTRRHAEADFQFPLAAVFGISYRPTANWNLEFNADYTDWSSFGTVTIYQQGQLPLGWPQNPKVTLDWQPSWMYKFGLTRYFDHGWRVSAGYVFNENSVPDAYYTPLAADLDRHFFSVGLGRKGRRFDFDVAYQFGYGPPRTVRDSKPSSLSGIFSGQNGDGSYEFASHAVLATVGMRF